jgi:hypothetical protein
MIMMTSRVSRPAASVFSVHAGAAAAAAANAATAAGRPPPGGVQSEGRPRSGTSRPAARSSAVASESAGDRRSAGAAGDAGAADTRSRRTQRPDVQPRSAHRQTVSEA